MIADVSAAALASRCLATRLYQQVKSVSSFLYVAVNTTLLALAADRRAAVDVDRSGRACCRRAMQQSTDIACPPEPTLNPQQQTRRTLLQRSIAGTDRQRHIQTEAAPLRRFCRILCEQCQ